MERSGCARGTVNCIGAILRTAFYTRIFGEVQNVSCSLAALIVGDRQQAALSGAIISLSSLWVDLTSLRRCSPRKIKLSTQSDRKRLYQFTK